jgi:hypothetical protein
LFCSNYIYYFVIVLIILKTKRLGLCETTRSAFSPNAPFDEERDLVFEKHIGSLQDLSLDHPVFGLSPTFHQLPFHLARKGRSSCIVCVSCVCVVCCVSACAC